MRFSAPVQAGPGAHPAFCSMDTESFPGVKSGRGMTLTPHPLLVPWSRERRATPLLPLWAVRPVQSLSACTRVHFTFLLLYRSSLPFVISNLYHVSKFKILFTLISATCATFVLFWGCRGGGIFFYFSLRSFCRYVKSSCENP